MTVVDTTTGSGQRYEITNPDGTVTRGVWPRSEHMSDAIGVRCAVEQLLGRAALDLLEADVELRTLIKATVWPESVPAQIAAVRERIALAEGPAPE